MNFEEPAGCQDKDGPRKRCRHDRLRIVAPPIDEQKCIAPDLRQAMSQVPGCAAEIWQSRRRFLSGQKRQLTAGPEYGILLFVS